jgi:hypothetical protein
VLVFRCACSKAEYGAYLTLWLLVLPDLDTLSTKAARYRPIHQVLCLSRIFQLQVCLRRGLKLEHLFDLLSLRCLDVQNF